MVFHDFAKINFGTVDLKNMDEKDAIGKECIIRAYPGMIYLNIIYDKYYSKYKFINIQQIHQTIINDKVKSNALTIQISEIYVILFFFYDWFNLIISVELILL
jgi:hypothetical protein